MLGGLGKQAVSSGMSFASTYALGHVAKRYYGGGRTLSTQMLREAFDGMLGEAQEDCRHAICRPCRKRRTLNAASILEMVRGR